MVSPILRATLAAPKVLNVTGTNTATGNNAHVEPAELDEPALVAYLASDRRMSDYITNQETDARR